jgi:amino acid transporter
MAAIGPAQDDTSRVDQPQLRRGVLSLFDVFAQSIADMGPSAAVGAISALVFATSGAGSWLVWALATVALLCVSSTLSYLAKRASTTGGLYALLARVVGPGAGLAVAWVEAVAVAAALPAVMFQAAVFLGAYLALPLFGLPDNTWTALLICLAFALVPAVFTYYDIRLSTRLMLILEMTSISLITLLMIIVLATHPGGVFNHDELTLHGLSLHTILLGGTLTIFAFNGFESCTVYGREARNPKRAIPASLVASVGLAGLFFVFCSYVIFLGFSGTSHAVGTSANPLAEVAGIAGVSWLGYIVSLGVIIGIFSVMIAGYAGGARFFLTLSREGLLPRYLGTVSARHHTPVGATVFMGAWCLVPLAIVFGLHASVYNAYGNLGSLAGYCAGAMYIGAGLFVGISVIYKLGLKRLDLTVAGFAGAVALGYGIYVSFNPLVPFPGDVWLFVFCGIVALACASYLWLRLAHRGVLQRIGSSVTRPEGTTGHAAEPLIGRPSS